MPADGLRNVAQSGMAFSFTGGPLHSGMVHSQLLFDNGVSLSLDDRASPSMEQPAAPEERWFASGGSLLFDDALSGMVAGAELYGWRWRVMVSGSGELTMTPQSESFLWLEYDSVVIPADVNGDGTVDVQDLLQVIGAWGPCSGCPEDINDDAIVDVDDLLEVLGNWGSCE